MYNLITRFIRQKIVDLKDVFLSLNIKMSLSQAKGGDLNGIYRPIKKVR